MIKYYWNLFKRVAVISTSSMLMYRSNMVFFLLFESFFLVANLGGLILGVNLAGGHLGGWSLNEVLFVASIYGVSHQFFTTFFMGGLFSVGWFVWSGRMDYVLLKPLHPLISQHAASEFIISNTPNLLINFGVFGVFCFRVTNDGVTFTFLNLLILAAFTLAGLAVRYGIALVVVAPAFLAEKLAGGEDAYWSLTSLAKYPTGVFPRVMQWIFTFLLPIASVAAIPAEVFFGKQSRTSAALHLGSALLFSWVAVKFYEFAASRYQSVNSGA